MLQQELKPLKRFSFPWRGEFFLRRPVPEIYVFCYLVFYAVSFLEGPYAQNKMGWIHHRWNQRHLVAAVWPYSSSASRSSHRVWPQRICWKKVKKEKIFLNLVLKWFTRPIGASKDVGMQEPMRCQIVQTQTVSAWFRGVSFLWPIKQLCTD